MRQKTHNYRLKNSNSASQPTLRLAVKSQQGRSTANFEKNISNQLPKIEKKGISDLQNLAKETKFINKVNRRAFRPPQEIKIE